MGQHAFASEPDHRTAYREAFPDQVFPEIRGLAEGWNVPTVRHLHRFDEPLQLRGAKHFVLTLHLAGPSVRRTDGEGFRNAADIDALSLQTPDSGIRIEGTGRRRVDYAHFYFKCGFLDEVAEAASQELPVVIEDFFARRSVGCEGETRDYLRRAYDMDNSPSALEMDSRAYLIGLGLLRHVQGVEVLQKGAPNLLAPTKVDQVHSLVQDRLSENIRLSEMAEVVGLSAYHFARLFKQTTGETPLAFVNRLRLERAVDLIKTTNLPVAHVAEQTGFANQSHLARRLKSQFSLSATDLRRLGDDQDPSEALKSKSSNAPAAN